MPKKILIVDDDPIISKLLEEELAVLKFETCTAPDGAAGLAAAQKENPDLILLDIVMPKMTGIEMLEKLRISAWGRLIPVILLTQLEPDEKIMQSIHKFEPSLYLMKRDWTMRDVAAKVRGVLSAR